MAIPSEDKKLLEGLKTTDVSAFQLASALSQCGIPVTRRSTPSLEWIVAIVQRDGSFEAARMD